MQKRALKRTKATVTTSAVSDSKKPAKRLKTAPPAPELQSNALEDRLLGGLFNDDEIVLDSDGYDISDLPIDPVDQDTDDGPFGQSFFAAAGLSVRNLLQDDREHRQDDFSLRLGNHQKSHNTQAPNLPNTGDRGRAFGPKQDADEKLIESALSRHNDVRGTTIDEMDFEEGAVRQAFCFIRDHARNLRLRTPVLGANESAWRSDAVTFFYCDKTLTRINFDECCDAIDETIRADVIRLRLNYELMTRWIALPPLPEDACGLPDVIRGRLQSDGSELDVYIAEQAWFQPGIDQAALVAATQAAMDQDSIFHSGKPASNHQAIVEQISHLVNLGVLGERLGHFYLIGRDPVQELIDQVQKGAEGRSRFGVISWSRLF